MNLMIINQLLKNNNTKEYPNQKKANEQNSFIKINSNKKKARKSINYSNALMFKNKDIMLNRNELNKENSKDDTIKLKNITRYLPSHLITNEVMLKIEKDKFFNESESDSDYTNEDELDYEEDSELQAKLDKYKLFFKLLEEDLIGYVDENKKLNEEMHDIEEEKDYFLGKLQNINIFCETEKNNF